MNLTMLNLRIPHYSLSKSVRRLQDVTSGFFSSYFSPLGLTIRKSNNGP